MTNIILFTNQTSIIKYWSNALNGEYKYLHVDTQAKLELFLALKNEHNIVMVDEQSSKNIESMLLYLKQYMDLSVLIFNNVPEVHHAFPMIRDNVKGYENSYINKINLINMLKSVEDGKKWLFSDLTNYIINKFIDSTNQNEPSFMALLTTKEKKISLMVADGFTNKDIAQKEKIALSTVKNHMKNIFDKAGVSDRVTLALKFR